MNWYKMIKKSEKDYFWVKINRNLIPSEVVKNPSSEDIQRLSRSNEIRMFLVGDDLYAWNPIELLHEEVASELQLGQNRIPLFGLTLKGKIFNVWVTDSSKNTSWHHDPKVKNIIMQNPNLMKLMHQEMRNNPDIGYYDQDIGGNWDDKEEKNNIIYAQNIIEDPTDVLYKDIGHHNKEDLAWIQLDGKIKVEPATIGNVHEEIFDISQEEVENNYRGRIEFSQYGNIRVSIISPYDDYRRYQQIPEDIILYFQNQYGSDVEIYVY
jgi:phage pi2 protein 07